MNVLKLLKKYWLYALPVIALSVALGVLGRRNGKLKQERESLSVELAHAQMAPPIVHDTIRDTVPVSTAPVVVMEKATYKKEIADRQLLKDLRLRAAQVETQQLTGTETHDTVSLSAKGTAVYEYHDRWADFRIEAKPTDTLLAYSVRDSAYTIVYREYKHRFLWWKWGTKGYKVKVVNFNPHATIRYNQYIKIE